MAERSEGARACAFPIGRGVGVMTVIARNAIQTTGRFPRRIGHQGRGEVVATDVRGRKLPSSRRTESGKPVAAICHGPWTLLEAGVVRGRTVTSYPSIRTDLHTTCATVVDQEVATDGNLITSRSPKDLPAFCAALIGALADLKSTSRSMGRSAGDAAKQPLSP